ncbi:MAG: hypothetical protein ABI876_14255, partial [Bacteroidota bacterium]
MEPKQIVTLSRFGFSFERGSAHNSRTMMLTELRMLLAYVDRSEAVRLDYRRAIEEDNCLGKRTGITRTLSYHYLV